MPNTVLPKRQNVARARERRREVEEEVRGGEGGLDARKRTAMAWTNAMHNEHRPNMNERIGIILPGPIHLRGGRGQRGHCAFEHDDALVDDLRRELEDDVCDCGRREMSRARRAEAVDDEP